MIPMPTDLCRCSGMNRPCGYKFFLQLQVMKTGGLENIQSLCFYTLFSSVQKVTLWQSDS